MSSTRPLGMRIRAYSARQDFWACGGRATSVGTWFNIPAAGGVESSPPTSGPGDQDGNAGSGCQCGYDQTVGVDPLHADRVYIGFQELWLSTNGTASPATSVVFGS